MPEEQLLVSVDAVAAASTDALLATAHTLLRAATDRARAGTTELSREQLIDQIVHCQQVQNTAWAAQSIRLAQVVAIEEVLPVDGAAPREVRHPIGTYTDEWLPLEIGTRLGWSDRQATARLEDARDALRSAPKLFRRTIAGGLDPRKLSNVVEILSAAPPEVARQVESGLLADIEAAVADSADSAAEAEGMPDADGDDRPVPLTSTKLVRRARRLLAETAPADADKAAAKRRSATKGVCAYPHHEPGLSVFRAVLPTEDAMRVMAAINELARQLHQDTTTGKSLDECRVDAFVDLLLSNVSVSTTCVVQVPLQRVPADAPSAGAHRTGRSTSAVSLSAVSFVEARLEQLLQLSADEGLDLLSRWVTPTSELVIRTPHGADVSIGGGAGQRLASVRFAPPLEIDLGTRDSGCRQRWDPGDASRVRPCTPNLDGAMTAVLAAHRHRGKPHVDPPCPDGYQVGDVLVEGLGVIPAAALTELCRALGTKLTRALVDAETGATVETADRTYQPGARLRRFVLARDLHCRFPGCTRPARLDDVDHVVRWPDGDTVASNLQCLCRHHHRAKHEGGWAVSMTPDAVCTWTSPSGRTYLTRPGD